jgi:hypothetical protein
MYVRRAAETARDYYYRGVRWHLTSVVATIAVRVRFPSAISGESLQAILVM